MTGAEFENVKNLILNNQCITKEQLKGLENLQKQYSIAKTKSSVNGDIKKALYYRQLSVECLELIEKSHIKE